MFESKVVVTATVGTYKPSDYVTTLQDAILVNEYKVKTPDNAISKIAAKETPDFNKTAPIIVWQENHETTNTNLNIDNRVEYIQEGEYNVLFVNHTIYSQPFELLLI